MNIFHRLVNTPKLYSFFLFGARGTGKSTLLRQIFPKSVWIDLLDVETERRLHEKPSLLKDIINDHIKRKAFDQWVVIDEIQKIPVLLDVVHDLIETKKINFALTGSSARKLKRGGANLLAGRAFVRKIYPLTHQELAEHFDLSKVLNWGSLPRVVQFEADGDRRDFLMAYADTYLREEVLMEQLVRKIPAFRKFLEVAAQSAGKIINYSKIAKDISSDAATVQTYFEILEDTLIANLLPPYHTSIRKRQRTNPKVYFFDLGVQRALAHQLDIPVRPSTYLYGDAFEQFLIIEIQRTAQYFGKDWSFSYLRTKDDAEIDLIIERPGLPTALVEIKSTEKLEDMDINAFAKLAHDVANAEAFIFSQDPIARVHNGVNCLPWQRGILEIGLV